jgi:hypothetical protein
MQQQRPSGGANTGDEASGGTGILWGCLLSIPIWYGIYRIGRWCLSFFGS